MTKQGTDPLLSKEENIANLIEPPTEEELDNAITGNMGHLMVVVSFGVFLANFGCGESDTNHWSR